MNDPMLTFVKNKLEEDEGISRESLARLMASARPSRRFYPAALLAASFVLAACGFFFLHDTPDACRDDHLANVIEFLRVADGCEEGAESSSLVDTLQAWQDAPCLVSIDD